MTARPARRRRRTAIGAAIGGALLVGAAGLTFVGVNAIANSTAGEIVGLDDRPVVSLPATDNAALAVVDDQGQLTSLIIATMLPSGRGGSIVTVPVAADVNVGFGESMLPLTAVIDTTDPQRFFEQLEATVAVTLQFGEIVGGERLGALLEPTLPADVDLPMDVVDSDSAGDGLVVDAGTTRLGAPLLARALTAVDLESGERRQHSIDVALWSGVARSASAETGVDVPLDDLGRPIPAATIDEFFERFWSGPVQVRDLAIDQFLLGNDAAVLNKTVVIDRRDSVLVFAQVSPARVSAPNPGPVFRIEIPINDDQIDGSDTNLTSRRQLAVNLIGLLLFLEANIGSVDATPDPDGAPEVTRIEVADASYVDTMEELGPQVFGEVDVVVAEELIDGIDVRVRLGTGYFAIEDAAAGDSAAETTDDAVEGIDDELVDELTDGDAGTVVSDG